MVAKVAGMYTELGSNVIEFQRDMGKAATAVSSNQAKMNKSLNKITKGFKGATSGILSMRNMAVGLAGAAGLGYLVKRNLEVADGLAKTADMAGVSTNFLQEMAFAADQNGVSLSDMGDAVKRLQRRVGLFATDGGGPAAKAFEEMGIQVRDAGGAVRSTEDIFNDSVKKLETYKSAAEKAALASQLFGDDAGPRLLILLDKGSSGIEGFRKQAQELGLVMEDQVLRKSEDAVDKLSILEQVISTKVTASVIELAPEISALATSFTDALPSIVKYTQKISEAGRATFGLWDTINEGVESFSGGLFEMLGGSEELEAARQHKQMVDEEAGAIENLQKQLERLNKTGSTGNNFVNLKGGLTGGKNSKITKSSKGGTGSKAKNPIDASVDETANKIGLLESTATQSFENIGQAMENSSSQMTATLTDFVTTGKADFSSLTDSIMNDIINMTMKQSITDPLQGAISSGLGSLGSLFSGGGSSGGGIMSSIGSMFSGGGSSGGGIMSSIGSMFGGFFAEGGRPPVGMPSVVGEKGAELFIPDTAGTIIPNHELGGSSGSVNVSNTFNITASGNGDVKQQILEMLPEIERRSVEAVSRNISRGGNLAKQVGARR